MYSIKIAAKLVKIKQLYKKAEEQLSNFIVLSTYYLTFRIVKLLVILMPRCFVVVMKLREYKMR